jgi:membrane-bound metal-dependent hydrolase YbcI (DUF457 family)
VIVWSGKMHVQFNFLIWVMVQVGVNDMFLNPIPFLLGSLCPDADHRKAPMGKILPLWLAFRHRGFTHTIWGLFLFSSLVGLYDLKWGILFGCGYLLHLLEDSSTPMGINWFWAKRKPVLRTGGRNGLH